MTSLVPLLFVLIPLAMGHPMDDSDREMMMKFMMMQEGNKMKMMRDEDYIGDNKEMMMKYMMSMWKREKSGHYPGDADGCTKEEEDDDDEPWKEWAEKKEKREKMKKMKEEYSKFKEFMKKKEEAEMKEEEEKKQEMYEMWQKHQEMKKRQEKEEEFKDMIESFQEQKHKFAFKLTHEFLQVCQCNEITEQMQKMSMVMESLSQMNNTDLTRNMTSQDAADAMDRGDMEMLARKMSMMSSEEKKKVFMSGLIKSMCTGAQTFIKHMTQFEELYLMNDRNSTSNT